MLQAVLFTHVKERETLSTIEKFDDFDRRRRPFFAHCLRCSNVGVVFVYSSYGIEQVVSVDEPKIPLDVLDNEQRLYDALQIVVDNAANEINAEDPESVKENGPKFVFIGVRELACHLVRLNRHDPRLIRTLAHNGRFTYDSPKYAEAIIRLVRARDGYASDPVIRVDADVEVNEQALAKIIKAAQTHARQANPYWWFSGSYRGASMTDPVNAYAVRQHWLVAKSTWLMPRKFALPEAGKRFLNDLAEIGATQIETSDFADLSEPAQKLVKRRGHSKRRPTAQVISGAGLVASRAAIRRLPPFMNAPTFVIWIDDHLKRLLHEMIGDLGHEDIERVRGARLTQNRFPSGIRQEDVDLARAEYFERLLTGCLMEATIQCADGHPGPLAKTVFAIIEHHLNALDDDHERALSEELKQAARTRFHEVMAIWQDAEYGDDTLQKWAKECSREDEICELVAKIGVGYAKLCIDWPRHVEAIEQLEKQDAYWVFTKPRKPPSPPAIELSPRLSIKAQGKEKLPTARAASRRRPRSAR